MDKKPQRPDAMLLHGWAMDKSCWNGCLPYLSRFCRCLRIELPGHGGGGTSRSLGGRKKLMDYWRANTPGSGIWIGWSLGGMLAQQLACRHPGHVKQLICIAAGLRFLSAEDWPHGAPADDFASFAALFADQPERAMRRFLQLLHTKNMERSSRLRLRAAVKQAENIDELRWGLNCLAEHDVRASLRAYSGGVAFIGGAYDRLVSPASLYASSRLVKHGRTFVVPEAGHAMVISHPRQLAKRLLRCIHDRRLHQ